MSELVPLFKRHDGWRMAWSPLIPQVKPGERPGETDMREAINAAFYLLRTGCQSRYLPRDGFPPRSTVYNIVRSERSLTAQKLR
jgi:transposase